MQRRSHERREDPVGVEPELLDDQALDVSVGPPETVDAHFDPAKGEKWGEAERYSVVCVVGVKIISRE